MVRMHPLSFLEFHAMVLRRWPSVSGSCCPTCRRRARCDHAGNLISRDGDAGSEGFLNAWSDTAAAGPLNREKWFLRMVDLQGGVVDAEALLQHPLERAA